MESCWRVSADKRWDRGPREKSGETWDHREKRWDRGPTKTGDRGSRDKSGETGDHREKRWDRGPREKIGETGGPERNLVRQGAQREMW